MLNHHLLFIKSSNVRVWTMLKLLFLLVCDWETEQEREWETRRVKEKFENIFESASAMLISEWWMMRKTHSQYKSNILIDCKWTDYKNSKTKTKKFMEIVCGQNSHFDNFFWNFLPNFFDPIFFGRWLNKTAHFFLRKRKSIQKTESEISTKNECME